MITFVSTVHKQPQESTPKGVHLENCSEGILMVASHLTVVSEGGRGFRLNNGTGTASSMGYDLVEHFSSYYKPHPRGTTLVLTQTELS